VGVAYCPYSITTEEGTSLACFRSHFCAALRRPDVHCWLRRGGSSSANKPQTRIDPKDQAAVQEIILHLSDFPAGWRAENQEDQKTPECFNLRWSDLTITGRSEFKNFVQGSNTLATSTAGVYATEQQARIAFRRAASDKLAKCFADYMRSQSDKDFKVTGTSFGRLRFPHLADQSAGYEIAISLETGDSRRLPTSTWSSFVRREHSRFLGSSTCSVHSMNSRRNS
jgi:hypothetical protein